MCPGDALECIVRAAEIGRSRGGGRLVDRPFAVLKGLAYQPAKLGAKGSVLGACVPAERLGEVDGDPRTDTDSFSGAAHSVSL